MNGVEQMKSERAKAISCMALMAVNMIVSHRNFTVCESALWRDVHLVLLALAAFGFLLWTLILILQCKLFNAMRSVFR
jgi:hypothetical protein